MQYVTMIAFATVYVVANLDFRGSEKFELVGVIRKFLLQKHLRTISSRFSVGLMRNAIYHIGFIVWGSKLNVLVERILTDR